MPKRDCSFSLFLFLFSLAVDVNMKSGMFGQRGGRENQALET